LTFHEIATIDSFSLPPDADGAATAFARMGYDLETALADIIDNAIDAEATHVEITFFRTADAITELTIADNGRGMPADGIREAMQFAGSKNRGDADLGAYGLGLKTASFSQCKTLTVISKHEGKIAACRWTDEGIKRQWQCEQLDPVGAGSVFKVAYGTVRQPRRGTVVLWERLDRLSVSGDLEEFLAELLPAVELRLGLIFHRFLADGKFTISVGTREDNEPGFPSKVRPHDPFGYPASGRPGYPKRLTTTVPGIGVLELKAHIWPANSVQPEFRLGRRNGTPHQGIYFYRNNRLVQTGGWNGVIKDRADAELSLARVAVDLPASAARDVTVQKSELQLTAGLAQAIRASKAGKTTFTDYFEDARKSYRAGKRQHHASGRIPVVPGLGIAAPIRKAISKRLTKDDFVREIEFDWVTLPKPQIFAVAPDEDCILLNKKHRHRILGGVRASAADAPVVKLLIFLLLEGEFDRERTSAKRRDWLKRCNAVLYEAIKTL
jgi:hypothetical protein